MGNRTLFLLAVSMWVAALGGRTVTAGWVPTVALGGVEVDALRAIVVGGGLVAWRQKRVAILAVALVLFTLLQSAAAWQQVRVAVDEQPFEGVALLRSDPAPVSGGVRVRLEIDGRVYDARAWGSPAGWVRSRLMGEQVHVRASLRPMIDPPTWLQAQGIVGRATITQAHAYTEGSVHTRVANSVRRTIEHGASSLGRDQRALFTGLVYGDDRRQSPLTADNFAGAGLTHLLAVSGQNVAFLLAIGGPLLRRLGHRRRMLAVAVILLVFATMTRFEASVLRASTMAAIAATGALIGTAVPAPRVLMLTVIALLAADPLLVHSVAFQLSLAASAGILFWSARVARALPGPRPIVDALAVTATAQFAVAPVLLWRFGPLPVASLPANVLAGPAAGPAMMWGMTAGWLAGLVPASLAEVIHVPTRLLVGWIDRVALWCAALPLGELGVLPLAACGTLAWVGLRATQEHVRLRCLAGLLAVLLMPAAWGVVEPQRSASLDGVMLLRDEHMTAVVLTDARNPEDVLASLRRSSVGQIDIAITTTSSFAMADLVGWIDARHRIGELWAPEPTMGQGEIVPGSEHRLRIDRVLLRPVVEGDELRLLVAGRG